MNTIHGKHSNNQRHRAKPRDTETCCNRCDTDKHSASQIAGTGINTGILHALYMGDTEASVSCIASARRMNSGIQGIRKKRRKGA